MTKFKKNFHIKARDFIRAGEAADLADQDDVVAGGPGSVRVQVGAPAAGAAERSQKSVVDALKSPVYSARFA